MAELSRIAHKITFTLFLAQSLASAGFIASATVNSMGWPLPRAVSVAGWFSMPPVTLSLRLSLALCH